MKYLNFYLRNRKEEEFKPKSTIVVIIVAVIVIVVVVIIETKINYLEDWKCIGTIIETISYLESQ